MYVLVGRRRTAFTEHDVFPDIAGKQYSFLRHITDAVIEGVKGIVLYVSSVHHDLSGGGVIKASRQTDKRCFAAACGADKRDGLALVHLEADVFQHILVRGRIPERDVAELHRTLFRGFLGSTRPQGNFRVQHFVDTSGRDLCGGQEHHDHDHHHNGHDDIGGVGAEHHNITESSDPRRRIRNRDAFDDGRAHPIDGQRQCVHGKRYGRHQQSEAPLVEQLCPHQLIIGLLKFFRLIRLGIIGMDNVDSGEILAGNAVDVVGQLLHPTDTRHDDGDHDDHHDKKCQNETGCDQRKCPALIDDLDDCPDRHDGRFDHDLQTHGHQHLNLGNIIGSTVDQAGNRKPLHLLLAEIRYLLENGVTDGIAEARRSHRGQIAA